MHLRAARHREPERLRTHERAVRQQADVGGGLARRIHFARQRVLLGRHEQVGDAIIVQLDHCQLVAHCVGMRAVLEERVDRQWYDPGAGRSPV